MEPTAGTVELAYEERGLGQPIVFVPGLTFNRATWRPIMERLAPQFRCVSIDLPGQGESAGPARPMQEPDKFAELVASFARTGAQVAWR